MEDQEALREFCTLTLKQRLVDDQFAQSRAVQRATHIAAGEALTERLVGHGQGVVVTDPGTGERVMVRHKVRPVARALKEDDLAHLALELDNESVEAAAREAMTSPDDKPFHGCKHDSDPAVATLTSKVFAACAPLCFTTSSTLEVAEPLRRFQGQEVVDSDGAWMTHIQSLRRARESLQAMRSAKPKTYKDRLGMIGDRCLQAYSRVGGCMALRVNLGGQSHTFFMQRRSRFNGVKPMSKRLLYDSITDLAQRALGEKPGEAVRYVLDNLLLQIKRKRYEHAMEESYLTVVRKADRTRANTQADAHEIMTDEEE